MERERLEAIEALLGALPHGAAVLNWQGHVVCSNEAFLKLTGHDRQGAIGRSLFHDLFLPEDAVEVESSFREHVSRAHRPTTYLTHMPSEDPSESKLFKIRLAPIELDASLFGLALLEPVTDHVELRRRIGQLEENLNQLARLKHEISNSLMGLIGNAELLESGADLHGPSRQRVEAIFAESLRIRDVLTELGRLSRG